MTQLELLAWWSQAALLSVAAGVTLYARRSPAADSPWFWGLPVQHGATVALYIMEGKYNHRQAHIEDQYPLRHEDASAARRVAGQPAAGVASTNTNRSRVESNSAAEPSPLAVGPQPPTHELFISLTPCG